MYESDNVGTAGHHPDKTGKRSCRQAADNGRNHSVTRVISDKPQLQMDRRQSHRNALGRQVDQVQHLNRRHIKVRTSATISSRIQQRPQSIPQDQGRRRHRHCIMRRQGHHIRKHSQPKRIRHQRRHIHVSGQKQDSFLPQG